MHFCRSALWPDWEASQEGLRRQGIIGASGPNTEIAAVVSEPAGTFDRLLAYLSGNPELLIDSYNNPYPLEVTGQLYLAAWKLSGIDSKQQKYLAKLPNSWQQDGVRAQTKHIRVLRENGTADVQKGKLIPFCVLSTPS